MKKLLFVLLFLFIYIFVYNQTYTYQYNPITEQLDKVNTAAAAADLGNFTFSGDTISTSGDTIFAIDHVKLDSMLIVGNTYYLPVDADLQEVINNAPAGATIVLASGVYTITTGLTVAKQLNIRGQGSSGFVTDPVTASHGTLISSSTAAVTAFTISNDNVRISDLSINLTGAGSTGLSIGDDIIGVVLRNIDVIVECTGAAQGFLIKGSDVILRNLTYYVISSDDLAAGVYFWNDNTTTRDAVVDAYDVTGTVDGAATYAYAFAAYNNNDANTLTLNLISSVCTALEGTPLDIAVISTSTTTNNATVNAYHSTFNGADYDGYQSGSNVLAVGGSNLVNNTYLGTITYRATMVSTAITVDTAHVGDSVLTEGDFPLGAQAAHDTLAAFIAAAGQLPDIVPYYADTVPIFVFGYGNGNAIDTNACGANYDIGSFYNDGSDTILCVEFRGVVKTGLGTPTVGVRFYYDVNLWDGTPTAICAETNIVSTTSGTVINSFTNQAIPPGVWAWGEIETVSVGNKPTALRISMSGYKSPTY